MLNDRVSSLEHDNAVLATEVEQLRAHPVPQTASGGDAHALQQLTIAHRHLSAKLTLAETTLAARTAELVHAQGEARRARTEADGAYALAASARGREEEAKQRERDWQQRVTAAEEERRLSDLVVSEYADLVRTLEGRRTSSPRAGRSSSHSSFSGAVLTLDSNASSSNTTLVSSLNEGKSGLHKLLAEFSEETTTLHAEIDRLHSDLSKANTQLEAERVAGAQEREALARARDDLERLRLDDGAAAKMVSRYMYVVSIGTTTDADLPQR